MQKYPAELRKKVIEQIEGRKKIQNKLPTWLTYENILLPPALHLEQCSSEKTAFFKASLFQGKTLADLTGGLGVDTWAFAQKFEKVWYVEKNPDLFQIALHNFAVLGLTNVSARNDTAENFLSQFHQKVDYIYLDPARRNLQGKSLAQITENEPNVLELLPLLFEKTNQILLKTSPMFEIKEALKILPYIQNVYVVSLHNECKEVLYLLQKDLHADWQNIPITTFHLLESNTEKFTATFAEESRAEVNFASKIQTYLYEPNPSVLKAGFFRSVAEKFDLPKLHTHTHLYTHNLYLSDFVGRIFKVKSVLENPKKEIPQIGSQFNILVRNYPLSVAEICQKYKLKEGGKDFLIATTLQPNQKLLIWAERVK
ncbi:MAG: hypothetical protein RMJ97_10985 [Raineya sp.]|nr:class I SAM-dependent methyltransferase [Raineya sp.]MDW8297393.1 hypothetical protein [Raineya sp.]